MSIEWAEFDQLVVESKLELQEIEIATMDEWVGKRKEMLSKQAGIEQPVEPAGE